MSTIKSTPGPWAFDKALFRIHVADGDVRPTVAYIDDDVTLGDQAEADGRLIASAPDLLAELVKMRGRFYAALVSTGTDAEFASAAVADADLAIKRATEA